MRACRAMFVLLGMSVGACGEAQDVPEYDGELAAVAAGSDAFFWPLCKTEPVLAADGTYAKLSDTGLYCDIKRQRIDYRARFYEPQFTLWSDGADKLRFLKLPPGTQIDSTDMDNWKFPVGTRVWKQFSLDGVKLETRLLEKREDGTWFMMAFAWNDDETEAYPVPNGVADAKGTQHDIPSTAMCTQCHRNNSDTLAGVSAMQLARANPFGVSLLSLTLLQQLSTPPTAIYRFPGNRTASHALGYLYANCAHCHRGARAPAGLDLSTSVNDTTVEATAVYRTAVAQPLTRWTGHGYDMRIAPGAPEASGIIARMSTRVPADQMPRIGTEIVDDEGVQLVSDWISSLAPQ